MSIKPSYVWGGKVYTPVSRCPVAYYCTIHVRVAGFPNETWMNPEFSDFSSCRFPHDHSLVRSEGTSTPGVSTFLGTRRNVPAGMVHVVMGDIIKLFEDYAPGLELCFEITEYLEAIRFRAKVVKGLVQDLEGRPL